MTINEINNAVPLAFAFLLFCGGILLLTMAASIPYCAVTDRLWKVGEDDDDDEDDSTDAAGEA